MEREWSEKELHQKKLRGMKNSLFRPRRQDPSSRISRFPKTGSSSIVGGSGGGPETVLPRSASHAKEAGYFVGILPRGRGALWSSGPRDWGLRKSKELNSENLCRSRLLLKNNRSSKGRGKGIAYNNSATLDQTRQKEESELVVQKKSKERLTVRLRGFWSSKWVAGSASKQIQI